MSMYADSSACYWEGRQAKGRRRSPLLVAGLAVLVVAAVAGALVWNKGTSDDRILTQRRTREQTEKTHWKQCEARVNSRKECTVLCQAERNSIQGNSAHQACLKGCQEAHATSTALGCRGRISREEDLFNEIGGLAYVHCAKFQSAGPKPEVFATCRKYHRAGTKHGFRAGVSAIEDILDEEWRELSQRDREEEG